MPKPKNPKKTNGVAIPAVQETAPRTNGGVTETTATAVVPNPAEQNLDLQSAAPNQNAAQNAVQNATQKKTRKPEIVKSESRSNLVPINLEDEIRRLAYLLSERRGFQPGHEAEDWLSAEREVRQRYHQQSA